MGKKRVKIGLQKLLNKRLKLITFLAIFCLAVGIIVFMLIPLLVKIDYLLGSGLIVYVRPTSKSLNMHYGEISTVEFNVSTKNPFYCRAECSYSFYDQTKGKNVDSGNVTISPKEYLLKQYNVAVNRIGSGQDIYSFQASCRNIRTYLCWFPDDESRISTALVIVNYNLSEELSRLKDMLNSMLTSYLEMLSETDSYVQAINRNILELRAKGNLNSLLPAKEILNSKIDSLVLQSDKFHAMWNSEDYIRLNEQFNETFFSDIMKIRGEADNLKAQLMQNIETHSLVVSQAKELMAEADNAASIAPLVRDDNKFTEEINKTIDSINLLNEMIFSNIFDSYGQLLNHTAKIKENMDIILKKSSNISLYYFAIGQLNILRESDTICTLKNNCKNDAGVTQTLIEANESFKKKEFTNIEKVSETCSMLESINHSIAKTRNETIEKINSNSIVFPETEEFKDYSKQKKSDIAKLLAKKYSESFNETAKNYSINDSVAGIFEELMSKDTDFTPYALNPLFEENATLYLLSKINLSDESDDYLKNVCKNLALNISTSKIMEYSLPLLSYNESYNISPRVNTELLTSIPICCVFGQCSRCCNTPDCADDKRSYPAILVHGHSVRKSNTPDYSFDTFDKIQHKLQNEGYLSAGALLFADDSVNQGEWGLSGKPVTVKVSYYFDVYRKEEQYIAVPAKSESIDTYALRLNDIVNLVKQRTGKSKVNIIAYSMGGLVSRKYIQIFGDDSVYKLITIGTPHQGIIGKVAGMCPVLGESKECTDMQKGSLFLNRINDPDRQPKNAKIYNIMGTGCKTEGKNSDGVVMEELASLKGIVNANEYIVNGTCKGTLVFFHKDMINIEQYPEVYELVVKALKE